MHKKIELGKIRETIYETSNIDVPEIKVIFANNKMTVEFTGTEEAEPVSVKMVFIKVTA